MHTIVITACAIINSSSCRDIDLYRYIPSPLPAVCQREATVQAAIWAGNNPGWRVTKMRCPKRFDVAEGE